MTPLLTPLAMTPLMSTENAVGLGVAVVLLVFVVCALLLPEKF